MPSDKLEEFPAVSIECAGVDVFGGVDGRVGVVVVFPCSRIPELAFNQTLCIPTPISIWHLCFDERHEVCPGGKRIRFGTRVTYVTFCV